LQSRIRYFDQAAVSASREGLFHRLTQKTPRGPCAAIFEAAAFNAARPVLPPDETLAAKKRTKNMKNEKIV
jgi:hypothetical protein